MAYAIEKLQDAHDAAVRKANDKYRDVKDEKQTQVNDKERKNGK